MIRVDKKLTFTEHIKPLFQETKGIGRGGEGKEEGGKITEARAKVAREGGAQESEESEASARGGAEEAADEDCLGREETAVGSAQLGIDTAHC